MTQKLIYKLKELAYVYAKETYPVQQHHIEVFIWAKKPNTLDVRVYSENGFRCCFASVPAAELPYRALKALYKLMEPLPSLSGESHDKSCVLLIEE